MTWIDQRGRIFGRVNLIDAAVGVFCGLLLPLSYGAYALFRQPPPTILTIEPHTIPVGQPARIRLTGQLLRPYATARLGDVMVTYRLQDTDHAELEMPATFQPGHYRLDLLDEANVVASKSNAVTVEPPPVTTDLLPTHPVIRFRPQWITAAVEWSNAEQQLNTLEGGGWELYTILPCHEKLCLVARKPIMRPVN